MGKVEAHVGIVGDHVLVGLAGVVGHAHIRKHAHPATCQACCECCLIMHAVLVVIVYTCCYSVAMSPSTPALQGVVPVKPCLKCVDVEFCPSSHGVLEMLYVMTSAVASKAAASWAPSQRSTHRCATPGLAQGT